MEQPLLNGTAPMSDEMVDDLLNQFLKTVDDDDSSSLTEQRTDEDGHTMTADGLTSGSDAKQSDGFCSPKGFTTDASNSGVGTGGRLLNKRTPSLDDDEGTDSLSSNNANVDPRGDHFGWFPSAAVTGASDSNALPGRMFPPGYERQLRGSQTQTSSEDSDGGEKVGNRHGGVRSPSHVGGRGAHAAPRAGLDVLRNPGEITQQWPPQVYPNQQTRALPKNSVPNTPAPPPPPAYPTAWQGVPGVFSTMASPVSSQKPLPPSLCAHRSSASVRSTAGPNLGVLPVTAQPTMGTSQQMRAAGVSSGSAVPSSFVDPQLFAPTRSSGAATPALYYGGGAATAPAATATPTSAAPHMMMLPQGSQPPQQSASAPFNPQQQTVVLTMAQLSALVQQQQQLQPQQSTQPRHYGQMPSHGMSLLPGFTQASAAYPAPQGTPSAATNPIYVVYAPPQSNDKVTPPSTPPAHVFGAAPVPDSQKSYQTSGAVSYNVPAAATTPMYPLAVPVTGVSGSMGATSQAKFDVPPPQYHDPRHSVDTHRQPPQPSHRRLNDDPHGHHAQGPPRPAKGSTEHLQAANADRLPRPPWQLPPRTPAAGDQNGGGGGNGINSTANVRSPAPGPVHAWVRRSGRWQPLIIATQYGEHERIAAP